MPTSSSIDQYVKDRVEDQIQWYDTKSSQQKNWFYFLRTITIVTSVLVPFTAGLVVYWRYFLTFTSFFGIAASIAESISSLTKVQEKWIQYRNIAEQLKHELYMFKMKAGVYDDSRSDIDKTFVERVETIISSENVNWANLNNNSKEGK
ncbi:DUF4231 domain-containing protein [Lacticaseibacillus paracasei]|uniref:DUF4231 domain-containing protein n=1 Tax=Lacticaseibacillus paracasei TaxID=1597 RepID=UPI000A07564E|nr:DUF4231 domain-containing protein [Lacticaseibacillus paracasei]ORI32540.1 hypothetical protein BLL61_01205 [Lacticaseibacillus casei]